MLCSSLRSIGRRCVVLLRMENTNSLHTTLAATALSDGVQLDEEDTEAVYDKALEHWTSVASDVDGMLGGFAQLHAPDISASRLFLAQLRNAKLLADNERALDCGCGIGRVTKHLLLPAFRTVDMIDFAAPFIRYSRRYIGEEAFRRVGEQFTDSLHVFEPRARHYDLIWVQWVTGHLTDKDFVGFLRRCQAALRPGGCVVVKDNLARGASADYDSADHSWTRPHGAYLRIFRRAPMTVVADRKQTNFPKGIYEVRMFALQPRPDGDEQEDDNEEKEEDEEEENDMTT